MNNRKTPRAQRYDYTSQGGYFVTICTKNREHNFGSINNECRDAFATRPHNIMKLTEIGKICEQEIQHIGKRKSVDIHEYVVMPNHVHMIIIIGHFDQKQNIGYEYRTGREPVPTIIKKETYIGPTLSQIIASFKGNVTKHANKNNIPFQWQPRYHDRIIRNNDEYERIANYIQTNPERWEDDMFYEENMNETT